MEIEFKKDLMHNYLVIAEKEYHNIEPYSLKILANQDIEGLLLVTQRQIDDKLLFYYEITAKQSMKHILDKAILSYDKVKQLCSSILATMERTYDYLLPEEDYILSPEYIYIDVITYKPCLCYFPGYGVSINKQMNGLLEYLMNKVDYNDKEAVLLVYQLYAVTREDGFTLYHFKEVLYGNSKTKVEDNIIKKEKLKVVNEKLEIETMGVEIYDEKSEIPKKSNGRNYENIKKGNTNAEKTNSNALEIPVMMERIEGETEVACYSLRTYLLAGGCIIGGILIIVLCIISKLLYNAFGNQIDYSKLFALILIVGCSEGYLLKKILEKKNKITKMVKTCEYIDPTKEVNQQEECAYNNYNKDQKHPRKSKTRSYQHDKGNAFPIKLDKHDQIYSKSNKVMDNLIPSDEPIKEKGYNVDSTIKAASVMKEVIPLEDDEDDFNPTCLLNPVSVKKQILMLKSLDEVNYKNISLVCFPFFIGKLKKNVDFCLEKDVVSRFHAKITQEEDTFYLTDLNSTNGSFINQEPLMTYQKKEIKFGDEIAFADIRYQFREE